MLKEGQFPKGFLWGAATSAHQVEGNTRNDWTEWEKENAPRLASEAKARFGYLPNWSDIEKEATDPNNYISGIACDHYNRYKEDLALAKSLGHNAHRFSIEWSRVEPEEGKFNQEAIEHYREVIKSCRENGLEPFVTLWHWPLPLWLSSRGGILNNNFPNLFSKYVRKVAHGLTGARFWITLNEPEIYTSHSYLKGLWPPQKKSFLAFLWVMDKLTKSHLAAYAEIKKINPEAQIGIAKNNVWFEATGLWNKTLKTAADWFWNHLFLDRISKQQDFIGLNHYFHNRINYRFNKNENKRTSDMGWELYPESIYHCLMDLKKYNKPIYITENGIADKKDNQREKFIRENLKWVLKALKEGVDIRSYFYWSLLDNFEWDKGFWPRFGLVEVDRKTLERKIRPSAYVYKKIIENGLE